MCPESKMSACFISSDNPTSEIQIDRRACSRYGVNVANVEEVIQVAGNLKWHETSSSHSA